jgi:hypothetical protein
MALPVAQATPTYKKGELKILDMILGVPGASRIIDQVDYEGFLRWVSENLGIGAGELCSPEGQRRREREYRGHIDAYLSRAFGERGRSGLMGNFSNIYATEIQRIAWEMQRIWCHVFWACVEGSWLVFGCEGDAGDVQLIYNQEAKNWLNAEIDRWIAFQDATFRRAPEEAPPPQPRAATAGGASFFPALAVGGALMFWFRKRKK